MKLVSLKLEIWRFEMRKFETGTVNLETWNCETWKFTSWNLENWNFQTEILKSELFKFETLRKLQENKAKSPKNLIFNGTCTWSFKGFAFLAVDSSVQKSHFFGVCIFVITLLCVEINILWITFVVLWSNEQFVTKWFSWC